MIGLFGGSKWSLTLFGLVNKAPIEWKCRSGDLIFQDNLGDIEREKRTTCVRFQSNNCKLDKALVKEIVR